jgi:serine/threonine protein kinase
LHSKGIIHGDLKPANILLDQAYTAKLCDFGMSSGGSSKVFFSGGGTPGYMAPEILVGGATDTERSSKLDIWALGCTLWAMVEIKEPFEDLLELGPSIFWIAEFVTSGKRLSLESLDWPPVLRAMVLACWDSNAELRPDVFSMRQQLHQILLLPPGDQLTLAS